ncbi:MAG: response regulator [Myxococcota bacterium]|nr:response regulator [Myxococcota bacterium]
MVLTVTDTGSGMDDETRARAFDPFFTTKGASGTGLGLATVYGIVVQHGGHVELESAPGRGTCVRISLPGTDVIAPERDEVPPSWPLVQRAIRVLLVEDDPDVRRSIQRVLEDAGHQLRGAPDGASALELARTAGDPFDVLLSDVVMPRMSGPELAERLREVQPGLRVIFMSGHSGDALEHRGMKRGAPLLAKPFTPEKLLDRIRGALS